MRKLLFIVSSLLLSTFAFAADHVMEATKRLPAQPEQVGTLRLSLPEAQDYAVGRNRTLKNASLAVQEAYAQRWQTIASMLPSVDASGSYTNYCNYSATMSMMGNPVNISMPDYAAFTLTAAVGINGQGVVGALLQNLAIDMKKIALEQSEAELRGNVMSSYVSVLALQSISNLLDSSLTNVEELERMTRSAVEAGAAERTTADQIHVRVNALKNSINTLPRRIW